MVSIDVVGMDTGYAVMAKVHLLAELPFPYQDLWRQSRTKGRGKGTHFEQLEPKETLSSLGVRKGVLLFYGDIDRF